MSWQGPCHVPSLLCAEARPRGVGLLEARPRTEASRRADRAPGTCGWKRCTCCYSGHLGQSLGRRLAWTSFSRVTSLSSPWSCSGSWAVWPHSFLDSRVKDQGLVTCPTASWPPTDLSILCIQIPRELRNGRSSVQPLAATALATLLDCTLTTAACLAAPTRTGSLQRVSRSAWLGQSLVFGWCPHGGVAPRGPVPSDSHCPDAQT